MTQASVVQNYRPKKGIKGYALVVHGLNNKPEVMEPIISILTESGIYVSNLHLRGHGDNYRGQGKKARLQALKSVTKEIWLSEMEKVLGELRDISSGSGKKIYFVGYSLGGALGLNLMSTGIASFDKLILFAPAIVTYKKFYLLKILSPFKRLVLPSDMPKYYRTNDFCSIAAYMSLFELIKAAKAIEPQKINVPALIFIDRFDEAVNPKGIEYFIKSKALNKWKIKYIKKILQIKISTI